MVITVDELRTHIQDFANRNIPLSIKYLTDADLQDSIDMTIDRFNTTPPILLLQYDNTNFPYRTILMDGCMYEALERTALIELRAEMQYSDGGINSSVYYKTPQFTQLKNELLNTFERATSRIKRHLNTLACYGGMR